MRDRASTILWILVLTLGTPLGACTTLGTSDQADAAETQATPQPEMTLDIALENDSEAEREVRDRLQRLLREHDPLQRWIFTDKLVIDEGTRIPHSHPVLTLNTRIRHDTDLLSTFTHEQFHWLMNGREEATEAAIAEYRELFPEVPVRGSDGARSEYSTYLHLIVCDLEYQALTELVGREAAREHLAGMNHYRWIYRQVLDRPEVREVNARHGFVVP